jgi:hypothetical protein
MKCSKAISSNSSLTNLQFSKLLNRFINDRYNLQCILVEISHLSKVSLNKMMRNTIRRRRMRSNQEEIVHHKTQITSQSLTLLRGRENGRSKISLLTRSQHTQWPTPTETCMVRKNIKIECIDQHKRNFITRFLQSPRRSRRTRSLKRRVNPARRKRQRGLKSMMNP